MKTLKLPLLRNYKILSQILFRRVQKSLVQNFPIWQLYTAVIVSLSYFWIWNASGLVTSDVAQIYNFSSFIIPVLAIVSAASLLGATGLVSRFGGGNSVGSVFADVNELVESNYERLSAHPKESHFARITWLFWLIKRTKPESYVLNCEEMTYTLRPYWDGVWYYGANKDKRSRAQLYHYEVFIAAFITLKIMREIILNSLNTITISGGGTQGSIWFLEEFGKKEEFFETDLFLIKSLSESDVRNAVYLCVRSAHYMLEELRNYSRSEEIEEYKRVRFLRIFLVYFVWLSFFHTKLLRLRFFNTQPEWTKIGEKVSALFSNAEKKILVDISRARKIEEVLLQHKGIIEKLHRIRINSIIPALITAAALFSHTLVPIFVFGVTSKIDHFTYVGATYAITSAAILINFVFVGWMLIPWRTSERDIPYVT